MEMFKVSENAEANRLINGIIIDLKKFSDNLINHIKRLTDIGTALSGERSSQKLLEMIVIEAMSFTNADGGTLYIVSPDAKRLNFEIVQNISLNVRMGGTNGKITWPAVRLINDDGSENHSNVSAHVAITGETVNIADVYDAEGFDFRGTKDFDKNTNYRSKSMLVVPLRDHEDKIIGVLQLLNAQSVEDKSIIPFSPESQAMTLSLASQAAVSITKNRLIQELEDLFDAFIRTIATAIDEKSPYTGGHIKRVANIALMIAEKINEKKDGPYASTLFTSDELNELRIAAWMHDIGKITTPEYIVDKATKLETKYDRINEIRTRFEIRKREVEINFLKKKMELMQKMGEAVSLSQHISQCEAEYMQELKRIEDDLEFISTANIGGEFMAADKIKRVRLIASNTWQNNGEPTPLLTEEEIYNLTIEKGTMTKEEREIIQNHVRLTEAMLTQLPFPKKLKNVPKYASAHHEKLDGTGYHKGLKGEDMPLQARIIAFADIFEALSAADRPYKRGKTASEVQKIMGFMVKDRHLDKDIHELFFNEGLFLKYVKEFYKPDQIDISLE